MKYSPKLNFIRDHGIERGNRVMEILDDLEASDPTNDQVSE